MNSMKNNSAQGGTNNGFLNGEGGPQKQVDKVASLQQQLDALQTRGKEHFMRVALNISEGINAATGRRAFIEIKKPNANATTGSSHQSTANNSPEVSAKNRKMGK